MVRAVKTKAVRSPGKGEQTLVLPGATGAEPWEIWIMGRAKGPECVQTCASPLDHRLRKNATLAFPVSQVTCLPLWLNETDTKLFAGIIPLQLEMRGLQPRNNGSAIFDWSVVAKEGTRTLVLVAVLPAMLPPELQAEFYNDYDLSARCYAFPENSLTLWRQQDRLAVAITHGHSLIYSQALTEAELTPRVLQDLNCICASLAMQDVLPQLQQVMLWTHVSSADLVALRAALPYEVQQAECPSPRLPQPAWKLTPSAVGVARKNREIARWRNRGLALAFVIYLVFVAIMVGRYVMLSRQVDDLNKWQTAHAPELARVHQAQDVWKELEPVVDKSNYPLELLKDVQEVVPTDQLNLTLFQASGNHVLMKAEAKNVAAAYQFLTGLQHSPNLTQYTFNMGEPQIASTDLAKIQIDGYHK